MTLGIFLIVSFLVNLIVILIECNVIRLEFKFGFELIRLEFGFLSCDPID